MRLLKIIFAAVVITAICIVGGIKTANSYLEAQSVHIQSLHQTIRSQVLNSKALWDYNRELIAYYESLPPEVVVETVYVDRPVEKIVEKVVEKEVQVEVIKWENIYARQWESLDQFKQWYEDLDFRLLLPSPYYVMDCDDYANRLQRLALQQGYSVSQAITRDKHYAGIKVTEFTGLHAGNLVLIDNAYYWVEPQPDIFSIKRICRRD